MDKDVLFREFEKLEGLQQGDFLKIEEYGGGPDESCLKGTKNALNHFAFEILKATFKQDSDYGVLEYFDDDSVAGIDHIVVVELKNGRRVEPPRVLSDRFITSLLIGFVCLFCISAIFGFITAIRYIF
jgi:hypothetical protein